MANTRIKYPLTQQGKDAAKLLIDAWDNDKVNQLFTLIDVTAGGDHSTRCIIILGKIDPNFEPPSLSILLELSNFNLIQVDIESWTERRTNRDFPQRRWHVLLMEELRNAVKNDFDVSDYFLTFNAVGTIIHGDATISAPYQSGASIFGNVSQTMPPSDVADKLVQILGGDFLQSNKDIALSIDELRHSLESEQLSKKGKVIMQLGNSLQHIANAYAVAQAIAFLAQVIH